MTGIGTLPGKASDAGAVQVITRRAGHLDRLLNAGFGWTAPPDANRPLRMIRTWRVIDFPAGDESGTTVDDTVIIERDGRTTVTREYPGHQRRPEWGPFHAALAEVVDECVAAPAPSGCSMATPDTDLYPFGSISTLVVALFHHRVGWEVAELGGQGFDYVYSRSLDGLDLRRERVMLGDLGVDYLWCRVTPASVLQFDTCGVSNGCDLHRTTRHEMVFDSYRLGDILEAFDKWEINARSVDRDRLFACVLGGPCSDLPGEVEVL